MCVHTQSLHQTASSTTILFHCFVLVSYQYSSISSSYGCLISFPTSPVSFRYLACCFDPQTERHPSLAFNLRPWTRLGVPVHSCPRTRTHVARCYGPVVRPRCEYLQRLTVCLTPPPYTPIYRICMHVHRRQVDRRAMIQCYNPSLIVARKRRRKTKKGNG